jgi:hypothetical protein
MLCGSKQTLSRLSLDKCLVQVPPLQNPKRKSSQETATIE